jgi:aspartokinase
MGEAEGARQFMTTQTALGGFKILKNLTRIAIVSEGNGFPQELFRTIAEEKINLPYVTLVSEQRFWGLNLVSEAADEEKLCRVLKEKYGNIFVAAPRSAVLSVFPHRRNPEISARLFEAFEQQSLEPDALANSPSTISIVLKQDLIDSASHALFEPFTFSAYQTPEDWKLVQEGKEKLYKEVVASYQEKKPKVYGLEFYEGQHLFHIKMKRTRITSVGASFRGFTRLGLNLTFLATSPSSARDRDILAFSLPASQGEAYGRVLKRIAPEIEFRETPWVTIFSMNGPHFGDRYGIVSDLFASLDTKRVNLLALSCTIASVTGVVPRDQFDSALHALKERFEIPSVTKRE